MIKLINRPVPPPPPPVPPVVAEGVLKTWGSGKCTVTVGDSDLKLKYNKNTEKSPGYKPQAKDKVRITYIEKNSLLTKIELIDRPVPPDPVKAEGTLTAWNIDGENKCTVETVDETLALTYDPKTLDIDKKYKPKAGDTVSITYIKDGMTLKSIKFVENPDVPITADGTLTAWGIDGKDKCTVDIDGSGVLITATSSRSLRATSRRRTTM